MSHVKEDSDHKVDLCRALQSSDFIAFAGVLRAPENPFQIPLHVNQLSWTHPWRRHFGAVCEAHEIKARSSEVKVKREPKTWIWDFRRRSRYRVTVLEVSLSHGYLQRKIVRMWERSQFLHYVLVFCRPWNLRDEGENEKEQTQTTSCIGCEHRRGCIS